MHMKQYKKSDMVNDILCILVLLIIASVLITIPENVTTPYDKQHQTEMNITGSINEIAVDQNNQYTIKVDTKQYKVPDKLINTLHLNQKVKLTIQGDTVISIKN